MTYKSFEDYYREAEIKHLVLFKHNGCLISPPFCTDRCKDYSRVMIYKNGSCNWIDVDTPPATSKYNSMISIGNSVFFAPYGIWDKFNTVLEINFDTTSPHYQKFACWACGFKGKKIAQIFKQVSASPEKMMELRALVKTETSDREYTVVEKVSLPEEYKSFINNLHTIL